MKRNLTIVIAASVLLLGADHSVCQEQENKGANSDGAKPKLDVLERYDQMFLERDPLVDSVPPLIDAWNEAGEPIKAGGVPGKHTVLVFGCLT